MNMNLSYINEIQLEMLNELAVELINGLNINHSNVKELIWDNGWKCKFIRS